MFAEKITMSPGRTVKFWPTSEIAVKFLIKVKAGRPSQTLGEELRKACCRPSAFAVSELGPCSVGGAHLRDSSHRGPSDASDPIFGGLVLKKKSVRKQKKQTKGS